MRQRAIAMALMLFLAGSSVPAEAQNVPKQLEQSCEAGDLAACLELGELYETGGRGLKTDPARAGSLFERACNGGSANGCFRLGLHIQFAGDRAARDMTRAAQLYQKACDGKSGNGCDRLGDAYQSGEGVDRDYARASSLFERACDLGAVGGCLSGISLHQPNGALVDAKRWATFTERACDTFVREAEQNTVGQGACLRLGLMYDLGMSVTKDLNHANDLFKKGCLLGSKEACNLIKR